MRKNATPRASPTTVLLDPSTKEEPWKAKERISHPLHWKWTFIVPPRPVGSTLVTNNIFINIKIENASDGRFKIFFFPNVSSLYLTLRNMVIKICSLVFKHFSFLMSFMDINYKTENMHTKKLTCSKANCTLTALTEDTYGLNT